MLLISFLTSQALLQEPPQSMPCSSPSCLLLEQLKTIISCENG